MLANIRKPYLNVDSRSSPLTRQTSRIAEYNESDLSWASNRHLTNEERDQIDLQTRVILTRCADRIKAMEALEQRELLSRVSSARILLMLNFRLFRTRWTHCKENQSFNTPFTCTPSSGRIDRIIRFYCCASFERNMVFKQEDYKGQPGATRHAGGTSQEAAWKVTYTWLKCSSRRAIYGYEVVLQDTYSEYRWELAGRCIVEHHCCDYRRTSELRREFFVRVANQLLIRVGRGRRWNRAYGLSNYAVWGGKREHPEKRARYLRICAAGGIKTDGHQCSSNGISYTSNKANRIDRPIVRRCYCHDF